MAFKSLFLNKMEISKEQKIIDKAEIIANTIISQQDFYLSEKCNENHKQLLETMVGAAIWYLPQGIELWTEQISFKAFEKLLSAKKAKDVKLTKDHQFPRKIAASELFKIKWEKVEDPKAEVLRLYRTKYGLFNYVLPDENKRLVKYQKAKIFKSPEDSYNKAGIKLKKLSIKEFKSIYDLKK